jgi:hypothetical protein
VIAQLYFSIERDLFDNLRAHRITSIEFAKLSASAGNKTGIKKLPMIDVRWVAWKHHTRKQISTALDITLTQMLQRGLL